ncbi:spore coat protein U domain-containing protein [Nitrospirillum sp. BR 11752]|uniref:spore coat protein U domain-containing protein n=1 Tax=Nitrospirillum sp. BR 11752 TaxID=3104293 RepID=UPI002EA9E466|nr:spore coat protein U domain-containing protein [Nitrospirillum sp. BR 11752]MEE3625584.1 spore coat protein U domain-containing protein [Nitrospirillum sp. BR 11752]MEE3625887.1 spore coat protein U domain-containing protein [Nitrospirillum sp. BR 11752]
MIRFAAAALIAAASLAAAPAFAAASASGTIQLNSTVAQTCTVAVTDAGAQLNILSGSNAVTVGSVVETCNDGAGYQISVTSANGGTLKSNATGAQPISYTPIYDGQSSGSSVNVVRSSAQFNKTATVAVTVPANAQAIAGSYTDTLTITIQGK